MDISPVYQLTVVYVFLIENLPLPKQERGTKSEIFHPDLLDFHFDLATLTDQTGIRAPIISPTRASKKRSTVGS